MANTAVFVANKINGVAEIHSDIIKRNLFAAEYAHHPEKFTNVTNGIAQRRWLELANPELSALIDKQIGRNWRERFEELDKLNAYTANEETLSEFIQVKGKEKKSSYSDTSKRRKELKSTERGYYTRRSNACTNISGS